MNEESIYQIFENISEQYSSKISIQDSDGMYNYIDLKNRVDIIASYIAHITKPCAKPLIAIGIDPSFNYVASLLAAIKLNGIFFPLSSRFPDIRLKAMLSKASPDIVIVDKNEEKRFTEIISEKSQNLIKIISIDTKKSFSNEKNDFLSIFEFSGNNHYSYPKKSRFPEDACYIMSTSGSTGNPKLILGSNKGLIHFIRWEINTFLFDNDIVGSFLSHITFDVSLRDILVPLTIGGTLIIPDENTKKTPHLLYKWFENNNISLTHIVPTVFRMLTNAISNQPSAIPILPNLNYVLLAGESLFSNDIKRWIDLTKNPSTCFVNLYGPSETTLAKFYHRIDCENLLFFNLIPLGRPLPDTTCYVINDNKLCNKNELGEIYIHTPFMSHGYFEDESLNKQFFVQIPSISGDKILYRTGDLGIIDENGYLLFKGRIDNQLKLYGNRIEIGEIEHSLRLCSGIKDAAVTNKPDKVGNQRLIAYYVVKDSYRPTVESLRKELSHRLPDYMIPSTYVPLAELPLTSSLKVDRKALPEPGSNRPDLEQEYIPPSSDIEKELQNIWQELLSINPIGINDNFFSLGGTSMLSMHLVTLIKDRIGIELSVVDIFQYPTIAKLSNYFSGNINQESFSENIDQRANNRRRIMRARKNKR